MATVARRDTDQQFSIPSCCFQCILYRVWMAHAGAGFLDMDLLCQRDSKGQSMNFPGLVVIAIGLLVFIMSGRGLIGRHGSIPCLLPGVMLLLAAALGSWYAWVESGSLGFTLLYLIVFLFGIASSWRQILLWKNTYSRNNTP